MKCNMGKSDRKWRIIIGALVLVVHYIYYFATGYYCVWANLAFIPLITGIIGVCPAYWPFKINTNKK